MSLTREKLEAEALGLPASDRANLALRLLRSLDDEADDAADYERAWDDEIRRRLDDYRADRVQPVPAADVFADLRRRWPEH